MKKVIENLKIQLSELDKVIEANQLKLKDEYLEGKSEKEIDTLFDDDGTLRRQSEYLNSILDELEEVFKNNPDL